METDNEFNNLKPKPHPESNYRAISTPNPKQRRQMSVPATISASLADKDKHQFFANQDVFDAPDLSITVPISNDGNEKPKRYKDACMSPINVLESARKVVHTMTSPTIPENIDQIDSPDGAMGETFNQTDSMQSTTYMPRKSNETDSAYSMTDDYAESQTTEVTGLSGSGYIADPTDEVDGPKDIDVESSLNDNGFPSSEIYYDCVRKGSTCMPPLEFQNGNDDTDETGTQMSEDHIPYIPYEQTEDYQQNQEAMRLLYIKLAEAASDDAETDEYLEDEINWEMLNEASDKLIDRLLNSDDMKMIRRCHNLFPEKERRHALNICIQSLQEAKKEVESELKTKNKEIEEMVYDLWKHQQDISNIKRLKKSVTDLDNENKSLKSSVGNLEKDITEKKNLLAEKDLRIQELESKLRESEPRRAGTIQRRGSQGQRQRAVPTQSQSPRRQNTQYSIEPPRLSVMQNAYNNQSRTQNSNGRKLPSSRR